MPVKMLLTTTGDEVYAYHFDIKRETTECRVVCWRPSTETWLVVHIEALKPIEKNLTKKRLLKG